VAGDFMALDFPEGVFDVVVNIEVLSHVADKDAYIAKITRLLKPGGLMMMATQNRPVLEKHNDVHPAKPGQLRQWVDRTELNALLNRRLKVREISTITPSASKGLMRLVAGRVAKKVMRTIAGRGPERMLAKTGFGWTLMALAQKSDA
jgi:ubiquinone/menaquinone biosynthesis C-methylase UbiE